MATQLMCYTMKLLDKQQSLNLWNSLLNVTEILKRCIPSKDFPCVIYVNSQCFAEIKNMKLELVFNFELD